MLLSHVQPFATLWTAAHQAPLSLEFFSQEYWSGLPSPSPGDLPDPRIELGSPSLQADFYSWATREAHLYIFIYLYYVYNIDIIV